MKRLLPLLAALLLILSGCVEYDEELWLNSDGSGRAKMRLTHRSHYSNTQEIMNKLDKPGIHLRDIQRKESGDNMIYEVEFSFDSIEAFNNVNDQLAAADFWGQITLAKNPEGNIVFRRMISLNMDKPMETAQEYPQDELEGLFGEDHAGTDSSYMAEEDYINSLPDDNDILQGIYMQQQTEHPLWTYKLHVPWKIITASDNASSIDPETRVVSWKFDTMDMWNKYEVMTVEMKKGISWLVYALAGLVAALIAMFIAWMIRIRRRSHLKEAIKHRREREDGLQG